MNDSCDLFVLYKQFSNGGKISMMLGLDTSESDYKDILTVAECLASEGHDVKILHAVHYKDPIYRTVFGELIGSIYYRKCPDLLVDGTYFEYESFTTSLPRNAFRNMLHNGLAQSDNVIIRQCNLTDGYMLRALRGLIQAGTPISSVWLFDGNRMRLLFKTEG